MCFPEEEIEILQIGLNGVSHYKLSNLIAAVGREATSESQPDSSGFPAGQVVQPFYGWWHLRSTLQPVSTGLFIGISHLSLTCRG
jgi:hypothetical protein